MFVWDQFKFDEDEHGDDDDMLGMLMVMMMTSTMMMTVMMARRMTPAIFSRLELGFDLSSDCAFLASLLHICLIPFHLAWDWGQCEACGITQEALFYWV